MTAQAVKPLWLACYAAMNGLTVAGLGVITVRETPAVGTPFPYITFALAVPDHGSASGEGVLEVHTWDNQEVERIIDIQHAVAVRLDGKVLAIAGGTAKLLASSTPPIGRDPDGSTRHGVQIFRVMIHV